MSCCQILYNSEMLINEAHNNNFIFVLDNIPVSYLISKFGLECVGKNLGPSPADYGRWKNLDAIKEANNDVRNIALYLKDFTLPGVSVGTTGIENQFATIKTVNGKVEFSDLVTTFANDENWFIYRIFLYWIFAGHNPEDTMQFTEEEYTKNFYVDGHLMILDNNRDKVLEWKFFALHPKSIGDVKMGYANPDKIDLTVTWIYTDFVPADEINIFKRI